MLGFWLDSVILSVFSNLNDSMILSALVSIDKLIVLGFKPNSHSTSIKLGTVICKEALMLLAFTVMYAISCNAINMKPAITTTGFLYNATALLIVEHLSH